MTTILIDGLAFPEGPRWHEGRLWFSDMHSQVVQAVDLDGNVETVCEVPGNPSGLGWLPDGRLLVVSMQDRRLLRLDPKGLVEVADLSGFATFHCNDMVVDAMGRAYVGNFGCDIHTQPIEFKTAVLVMVTPEGECREAASELAFPNGAVITPDGKQLIVAETFASCLSAFDIDEAGGLSNRRVWATVADTFPDGICLDAEGAVWMASAVGHQVLRVAEGGEVLQKVAMENEAFACMLGGPEGRTLFLATAASSDPDECLKSRSGRIEMLEVEVPHAGLP